MLPILLGSATRFASMGLEADKLYVIELDLSYQTDTLDAEGEEVARFDGWQQLDRDRLATAVAAFTGTIDQIPPAYSAIRIDGQRSHKLARAGQTVEIPSRSVTIHSMDLLDVTLPKVQLRVHCSKGTYMRALARDLGASLGLGGSITGLRRLQTGGWDAGLMVTMDQLAQDASSHLYPPEFWLRHLPRVEVDISQSVRVLNGQRVPLEHAVVADAVVMMCGGRCLGVGKVCAGNGSWPVLHPLKVIGR